jgi:hypothetical protein
MVTEKEQMTFTKKNAELLTGEEDEDEDEFYVHHHKSH